MEYVIRFKSRYKRNFMVMAFLIFCLNCYQLMGENKEWFSPINFFFFIGITFLMVFSMEGWRWAHHRLLNQGKHWGKKSLSIYLFVCLMLLTNITVEWTRQHFTQESHRALSSCQDGKSGQCRHKAYDYYFLSKQYLEQGDVSKAEYYANMALRQ